MQFDESRFRKEFKAELLDAFNESLHSQRSIDDETHRDHHEFVKLMMEKEKRIINRNEKIKASVYGWIIITLIGGVGTTVYHFFIRGSHP